MKFSSIVVVAAFVASCVTSALDEGAVKMSVDGGLSEIADLQLPRTDSVLQEAVIQISPGSVDSIVIDTRGPIDQKMVENNEFTSNKTVPVEAIEKLSQAAIIEITENGTAAEGSVIEEEKVVEDGVVVNEIIPKGSNAGGIPTKVDKGVCVDRHPEACVTYVEHGECTQNPGWMTVNW